jgi:chromosome segregation ATPase
MVAKNYPKNMEIEEAAKEVREKMCRAISDALAGVREKQQYLNKDYREFKEATAQATNRMNVRLNSWVECIPRHIDAAVGKRFHKTNSALGGITTNLRNLKKDFIHARDSLLSTQRELKGEMSELITNFSSHIDVLEHKNKLLRNSLTTLQHEVRSLKSETKDTYAALTSMTVILVVFALSLICLGLIVFFN